MPIVETTVNVVNKGKKSKAAPKRERRVEEPTREEREDTSLLFDIKESKYHDDILNRDSRNK